MSLKQRNQSQKSMIGQEKTEPYYGAPLSSQDTLGLVALEPRILLDAAGFMTGADIAMDAMTSGDAQLGVDAIFDGGDMSAQASEVDMQNQELLKSLSQVETLESVGPTQDNDPTAAPLDGPWLNEIDPEDTHETDPTAAPLDGPWLNEIEPEDINETDPNETDPTTAPLDGPWLDEVTPQDSGESDDGDDPSSAPLDGPWLDEVTPQDSDNSDDGGDPTSAPLDGPWL